MEQSDCPHSKMESKMEIAPATMVKITNLVSISVYFEQMLEIEKWAPLCIFCSAKHIINHD